MSQRHPQPPSQARREQQHHGLEEEIEEEEDAHSHSHAASHTSTMKTVAHEEEEEEEEEEENYRSDDDDNLSNNSHDKSAAAKFAIEQFYENFFRHHQERAHRYDTTALNCGVGLVGLVCAHLFSFFNSFSFSLSSCHRRAAPFIAPLFSN
jgi:hypothetical protein